MHQMSLIENIRNLAVFLLNVSKRTVSRWKHSRTTVLAMERAHKDTNFSLEMVFSCQFFIFILDYTDVQKMNYIPYYFLVLGLFLPEV